MVALDLYGCGSVAEGLEGFVVQATSTMTVPVMVMTSFIVIPFGFLQGSAVTEEPRWRKRRGLSHGSCGFAMTPEWLVRSRR